MMDFTFFINSILLGVGLAMDAFSVSLANGLHEPKMSKTKHTIIAFVFAFFQFLMPMIGWICVHTITTYFSKVQPFIPYIALVLLSYIGGKMIFDGIKNKDSDEEVKTGVICLLVQGIATSIDALSVGFTISNYGTMMALISSIIIAVVTFIICFAGVTIGKKFGTKLSNKAGILGGLILILIGLEILIKSFL